MNAQQLPNPPPEYDQQYFFDMASIVKVESEKSMKIDSDNTLKDKTGAIIFQSPNGKYWRITISDVGALGTSEITTLDDSGNTVISENPYA